MHKTSMPVSVLQARDPELAQFAGAAGVIGALFAAFPLLRRWFVKLDFSPAAVTVAIVSSILTVILVIASAYIINQTSADYANAVSPPPTIVNTILPTADSVAAGHDLASACGWVDT
ncbi:MAG: hypothetical protein U0670_15815 [Anaerolineae bacterium]